MLKIAHRKILWKMCIFSVGCVLFSNVLLYRRFSGLELENMIDPGGTWGNKADKKHDQNAQLLKRLQSDLYSTFESRLRKLMEKSTENGLDVTKIQVAAPMPIFYSNNLIECEDFVKILNKTYLASGWTKAVYSGIFNGLHVAIKTVDMKGQSVKTCVEKGGEHSHCYHEAAQKIVKEIVVLQALANTNVIKVLGFCVPGYQSNIRGVAMVTELGESVDLIKLLQMSWENRFKISYDLTKIIDMMSSTNFGSIAMNDFRRQQFVIVNGTLKLSDVDDVGFGDPFCKINDDCTIVFSSSNFSQKLSCIDDRCVGYNEKKNLFNGGRHFTTFLLPHGAPESLRPLVNRVVDGYCNLTLSSRQILRLMTKIKNAYVSGQYLKRPKELSVIDYKFLPKNDLPGRFDYRCRLSLSGSACTRSVFDVREAADMCNADSSCRGFVLSKEKTWSGRTLVHFKSGFDRSSYNSETSLYVKSHTTF